MLCTCHRTPSRARVTGKNPSTATQQRRAAARGADRRRAARQRLSEIYAYLQAEDAAAGQIVNSLPEIASRPIRTAVISGAGGPRLGTLRWQRFRQGYALERQDWKQAIGLAVRETPFPYTDAMTWFARGFAAARLGQAATANDSGTALRRIRERLLKANENYWARQVEIQEVAVGAWAALAGR